MRAEFDHEVAVMGISVAALMTTAWVARFLEVPPGIDLILLPGHTQGDLDLLENVGDKGTVTTVVTIYNQRNELVLSGQHKYLLKS